MPFWDERDENGWLGALQCASTSPRGRQSNTFSTATSSTHSNELDVNSSPMTLRFSNARSQLQLPGILRGVLAYFFSTHIYQPSIISIAQPSSLIYASPPRPHHALSCSLIFKLSWAFTSKNHQSKAQVFCKQFINISEIQFSHF